VTLGLGERPRNAHSDQSPRWFVQRTQAKAVVQDSGPPSAQQAAEAPTVPIPTITGPPVELSNVLDQQAAEAPTVSIPTITGPLPAFSQRGLAVRGAGSRQDVAVGK